MAKRLATTWLPLAAFGAAILIGVIAGPALGALSRRVSQGTTPCDDCPPFRGKPMGSALLGGHGGTCPESGKPIGYHSGENHLTVTELSSSGFGGWTHARSYVSDPNRGDGLVGAGWRVGGNVLQLVRQGNLVLAMLGPSPTRGFIDNGDGTFGPTQFYQDTLVADTVNHLLILTDVTAQRWEFHDFSTFWAAALQGRIKSFRDRGGNVYSFTYGTSGVTLNKLIQVQTSFTSGPDVFVETWTYDYYLTGISTGLLQRVSFARTTNGGGGTTIRKVEYTYYPTTTGNGPQNTLQWAKIMDGSSNVIDVWYHRYNTFLASGQLPLRLVLNPTGYERALSVLGSEAAIDAATDATLDQWALLKVIYDTQGRVTTEVVNGAGCGCGSAGGKGTFTYAYSTATHGQPAGPNTWERKNVETLPDGNQNIVYTSSFGAVMLGVFKEVATGAQWRTYYQYDASGRLALMAMPSAVTGHDELNAALVTSAHLSDSSGLLYTYDYYATTDLPNGAVAGYRKSSFCKQGELGTAILQSTTKYTSRTGLNGTSFPVASTSVYRNTDGTGEQLTSFGYTWQGTTNQVLQLTTTHPIVPTNQNGSGSATSNTVQFDAYGRTTWEKDEDGFIHTIEYDPLTSGTTKEIKDVNTTLVTNEPAGWVTPAGGGLHLTTTYRPDSLGRDTKTTDPLGNITYTVYRDPQHEVRIYPGWNTTTNLPTGPTGLSREDRPGSYTESLTMSATPNVLGGEPTGTEAVSSLWSLSRHYLDTGDRVTHTDSYFNLTGLTYSTAPNLGTLGTNYLRARVNYDARGRQDRSEDWTGTITRTVYDAPGRAISTWIGTDDTPTSGEWSPSNTAGTNLIKVSENEYDNTGIGDGNLTRNKAMTSASTSIDTVYSYDFRNRLIRTETPAFFDDLQVERTLDNLGRVTMEQTFREYVAEWNLRFQKATSYDEKGRMYQTTRWNVDPVNGSQFGIGNSLTTNLWYNTRGLEIKNRGPNGLFQKTQYDGAGRMKATFVSYHDAESLYADADDVANDTVIDQTVATFDAASNLIQTTRYQRTSTTTKLGDLSVSWGAAQSRRTFTAQWFDKANRVTDFVNYGTNGGTNLVRPATPPAPNTSNNYLVTHTDYDGGGRAYRTTDNKARIAERTFDALGRVAKSVDNRVDGVVTEAELDTDRTTEVVYDSSGRKSQEKAKNPKGSGAGVEDQVTTYVYGTDANQATPAVFRNDLLVAVIKPDSDDTYTPGNPPGSKLANGADAVYDREETTHDYAGRLSTFKDPRGVVHTYAYATTSGLLVGDTVTTLPGGVDGAVRSIGFGYDDVYRPNRFTSYSDVAQTQVVNEVKYTYDGWANRVKREDSHAGAVVPGTTPSVQYAHADGGSGGVGKYVRLSTETYPNGRTVHFNYPAAGTVGDHLSRVDNVANDPSGTLKFAQYTYLGINVFGRIDHPQVLNGLRREVATGGNPGEWDRFGRVLDDRWKRSGATYNYDRNQYTYDRTSMRVTKDMTSTTQPPSGQGKDEFHVNDGLDRLTKVNRGALASGQITDANANFTQNWTALESLGNWRTRVEDTNGGGAGGSTTQTRTHNKANELLTVTGDSPAWAATAHDLAGNMTTAPQPGAESTALTLTCDAWNRLVKAASGATTLAEYQFDGEGWRIVKLKPNGANWDRRDYYYNMGWQVAEERDLLNTASKTTVATTPKFQWVWCQRYVDAVVLRDENKDGDNDCIDGTDQRLYYTQNAGLNTTALVEPAGGTVVERYEYDPYGKVQVFNGSWASQSPTVYNNEVLFAGYRQDPETALYSVRNRAYHPTLGRWVQRDPVGYRDSMSLYQYTASSPTNYLDPAGLSLKYIDPYPMVDLHYKAKNDDWNPPRPYVGPRSNFLAEGVLYGALNFTIVYELKNPFGATPRIEITASGHLMLNREDVSSWNKIWDDWRGTWRERVPAAAQEVPLQGGGYAPATFPYPLSAILQGTDSDPSQLDERALVRARHWMMNLVGKPAWHETTVDVPDDGNRRGRVGGDFPRTRTWKGGGWFPDENPGVALKLWSAIANTLIIDIDQCQTGKVVTWIQYPDHKIIGNWVDGSTALYDHGYWWFDASISGGPREPDKANKGRLTGIFERPNDHDGKK